MKNIVQFMVLALLFTGCKPNSSNEIGKDSNEKQSSRKVTMADQKDCFSEAKITSLPITKSIIDGNNVWNELGCNIADLQTRDYLRLPDLKEVKVFIIGNFNFDDFTYTLVTLKNNKAVTIKDIGFVKEGSDEGTISEFTEFEIDKEYVFTLNTKMKEGENFKIVKTQKFKLDQNGSIIVLE